MGVAGNAATFAGLYTFGNIVNLCATLFLVGPQRQCQAMWKPVRRLSAVVYITCMILTLVSVWIRWRDWNMKFTGAFVTFACVGLQSAAIFWYAVSYIPFGQSLVSRAL